MIYNHYFKNTIKIIQERSSKQLCKTSFYFMKKKRLTFKKYFLRGLYLVLVFGTVQIYTTV